MNKKIVKVIFIIIFLSFLISYIIEETGYYEYNLQNKTVMTKEAMDKFEEDLESGKDVTLEDYIVNTEKDYTSTVTKTTNKLSTRVNKVLKGVVEGVFKLLSNFVED